MVRIKRPLSETLPSDYENSTKIRRIIETSTQESTDANNNTNNTLSCYESVINITAPIIHHYKLLSEQYPMYSNEDFVYQVFDECFKPVIDDKKCDEHYKETSLSRLRELLTLSVPTPAHVEWIIENKPILIRIPQLVCNPKKNITNSNNAVLYESEIAKLTGLYTERVFLHTQYKHQLHFAKTSCQSIKKQLFQLKKITIPHILKSMKQLEILPETNKARVKCANILTFTQLYTENIEKLIQVREMTEIPRLQSLVNHFNTVSAQTLKYINKKFDMDVHRL